MDASEVMQREAVRGAAMAGQRNEAPALSYANMGIDFGDEGGYLVTVQDRTGKRVQRVFTDAAAARSFVEDFCAQALAVV